MRTPLAVAVIVLALLTPFKSFANDDAAACTPDVMRLCSAQIPWRDRITDCLREKKRQLSPACSVVFNRKPAKPGKPGRSDTSPTIAHYEPGSLQ
jgi:hypothetical protein